ncbi:MAG: hypothetical protein AAGF56_05000, partial [Pseudomonadota bacterium]
MKPQMFQPDQDGVYAVVAASAPRRAIAYCLHLALGTVLIYTAFAHPPALPWLVFLLVLGFLVLVQAERLRRATTLAILLTETDLRDTSGTVLVSLGDIEKVERG